MKKRIVCIAAGVLALSLGVYVSTRLWAQTPTAPQPPQHVQTRIGILNMGYVLKNYQKVDVYTAEMKDHFKRFDDSLKEKKNLVEARTKQANDPQFAAQREVIQKEITKLNREAEDMQNDMKKFISTKTDEQMVTIYKEIQEAAARYAMAQGLDLVLTHIDAVNEADYLNPMNVMGKMQQRACMPLYYNKGMDVSKDIVEALNKNFSAGRATTPVSAAH